MEQKSIGGLWIKESKNKNKFFRGSIKIDDKDYYIVIFKNSYKKDNQPDFLIYMQTPKETNTEIEEISNENELPF